MPPEERHNGSRSWTEYFRVITPFLLLVITGIGTSINTRLTDMDAKLFKHLTNDEIHTPKSIVITKAEFSIYQEFRNEQMKVMENAICKIEKTQEEHSRISMDNNMRLIDIQNKVQRR